MFLFSLSCSSHNTLSHCFIACSLLFSFCSFYFKMRCSERFHFPRYYKTHTFTKLKHISSAVVSAKLSLQMLDNCPTIWKKISYSPSITAVVFSFLYLLFIFLAEDSWQLTSLSTARHANTWMLWHLAPSCLTVRSVGNRAGSMDVWRGFTHAQEKHVFTKGIF